MRCFIAIDISESIKQQIGDLQDSLHKRSDFGRSEAKWVDIDLIHLTVKFLGEVKDNEIIGVCNAVKMIGQKHKRFSVNVKSLGSFGRPARVLWAGIDENASLMAIQKELDELLGTLGLPMERRKFHAHLTLCRMKNSKAGEKLQELAKNYSDFEPGATPVDAICVYRSDLTSSGPEYTVVSKTELK